MNTFDLTCVVCDKPSHADICEACQAPPAFKPKPGFVYDLWVDEFSRQAWFLERKGGGVHRWLAVNKDLAWRGQSFPHIPPSAVKHNSDQAYFEAWWARVKDEVPRAS